MRVESRVSAPTRACCIAQVYLSLCLDLPFSSLKELNEGVRPQPVPYSQVLDSFAGLVRTSFSTLFCNLFAG
jgi:hypothetical protein